MLAKYGKAPFSYISKISQKLSFLQDSSDEKPLEEKSGVNPVDRIVPFSHQEDQQQQTDNKDNSDIIEGNYR